MGTFIEQALDSLVGKKCKFETTDGSIRTEKVVAIDYQKMEIAGKETVLPVSIRFDHQGYDGVELRIVKKIRLA